MRPQIRLDRETLRSNARAWQARAGTGLRIVIKSQGYGWGFTTLVDALDDIVTGYYVSDEDEFDKVRRITKRPLITLVDVRPEAIPRILESGGIPTVSSAAGFDAAEQRARARTKRARASCPY
jgi:alanine racemase